jgi:hypothetical protein
MPLSLDHLTTIEADAARIRAAYDTDRDGRIPWSDRWTVRSVARHVAGAHHVAARIIHGRPTADFGLLDNLEQPPKNDPGFPAWFAAGTDALCHALRSTDLDEPCWTSIPEGRTVRFSRCTAASRSMTSASSSTVTRRSSSAATSCFHAAEPWRSMAGRDELHRHPAPRTTRGDARRCRTARCGRTGKGTTVTLPEAMGRRPHSVNHHGTCSHVASYECAEFCFCW